jgi:hypothetical protein
MKYCTYFFGTKLLPFLWVWLYSLHEQNPDIEPIIYYNHVPEKEIGLIKKKYPFAKFKHDDLSNPAWRRTAIAQKPMWLQRVLEDEPIYLFDSDVVFLKDPAKFYQGNADIMYTYFDRKDDQPYRFVNIGVMGFSPKAKEFVAEWVERTKMIIKDKSKVLHAVSYDGSVDQNSFANILRAVVNEDKYRSEEPFKVKGLVFNPVKCTHLNEWRPEKSNKTAIIHLLGPYQRWLLENEDYKNANSRITDIWLDYYKKARIEDSEADIHPERLQ